MGNLPDFASWITRETFEPYVGGYLEVTNPYQSYIYYGKIAGITLSDDGELTVRFEWQAVGVDKLNKRSRTHEGSTSRTQSNCSPCRAMTFPMTTRACSLSSSSTLGRRCGSLAVPSMKTW